MSLPPILALALTTAVGCWWFSPWIASQLARVKSRLIAKFVAGKLHTLFTRQGGNMELGEFKHANGSTSTYFKNAPKSLAEWYTLGKRHSDRDHIVYYGKQQGEATRESFAHVLSRAESLSRSLRGERFGVKKGDRVAILMSNVPEYAVGFMAVTRIQAIAVTLNAFWESHEIEFGLQDSGSTVLLVDERRFNRLTPSQLRALKIKVLVVDPSPATKQLIAEQPDWLFDLADYCNAHSPPTYEYEDIAPETDAYIMYTSGTTSPKPKGVVHTHLSAVHTTMCFQLFLELMRELRGENDVKRADLMTGPLFHAATLNPVFLLSFHDGHKLVMIPKWDTARAMEICIQEQITFFGAMPTLLQDMLKSPVFQSNLGKFAFTNIGTGGASVPSELIRRVNAVLPNVTQGSGWGLTETNAVGTIIGGPDYLRLPSSCGKPHPICKLKLVDPDTLQESTTGEGELLVQSITNMRGYWNNDKDTAEVLLPGNWVRSGDYARMDADGFVFIVDRLKEIVIRGGENISTAEVESVIYSMSTEGIAEVVCFGLPHDRLGEQLCAAIVPMQGHEIDPSKVKLYCTEQLAKFKVPSLVVVRSWDQPLPRSATNKVLKRLLREEYKSLQV